MYTGVQLVYSCSIDLGSVAVVPFCHVMLDTILYYGIVFTG